MECKLVIVFFIILSLQSCGKEGDIAEDYLPYYHKIDEANYLNFKKENEKSDSLYEESFKLVLRPFYEDYLKAAKNAIHLSDEKVYKYLMKGIERGLRLERIEEDTVFKSFSSTLYWQKIERKYEKKRKRYESTINIELGEELKCMFETDQLVRNYPEEFEKSMKEIDDENLEILVSIIKEHGYPGYSMVGEEIGRKFPIMFHHFEPDANSKYFDELLDEAMKKGEISPFRNAMYKDYDRIKSRKKTLYGIYWQDYLGERTLYPVEDYKNIDEIRICLTKGRVRKLEASS